MGARGGAVGSGTAEGRGFDSRWCHRPNRSDRPVALGSTQPLTEVSTINISLGVKADGA